MSYSDDDDAPPPLSSLSCQVDALLAKQSQGVKVASVTQVASGRQGGLKKGFFDRPPTQLSRKLHTKSKEDEEVIHIKANPSKAKAIPASFMLDHDAQTQQLNNMKQKVADALKPTPELMKTVTSNQQLLSGFDDPEVMAAVNEVAQNPSSFKKYANNAKVVAFYKEMANFAGNHLMSKTS